MSLFEVKHQAYAQRLIQRATAGQRLPHAYLFHGPEGVGKELFARGLAELLLCARPVDRTLEVGEAALVGVPRLRTGCGRCEDCRMVAAETHPDLHLIYRQLYREHPDAEVRKRKGLELTVDVVRHFVIDRVGLTPNRGRAKVFIIREADEMNPAAQNAFLKTLEEPPGTTYLILLASSLDDLLPTTQSRCQLVRFDALPDAFVRSRLSELRSGLSGKQAEWYAGDAGGSIGRAVESADDGLCELHEQLTADLGSLRAARTPAVIDAWTDASKALGERYRGRDREMSDSEATRRGLKTVFRLAAGWYGEQLKARLARRDSHVSPWDGEELGSRAAEAINRIAEAEQQLDLNANTQLCVETLVNGLILVEEGSLPTTRG